jgi:hypothetical protein
LEEQAIPEELSYYGPRCENTAKTDSSPAAAAVRAADEHPRQRYWTAALAMSGILSLIEFAELICQ